jgi:type I restriction enzyme S subunit
MNEVQNEMFPSEWDIVSLSDISNRITRKNNNEECKNVLTISAQFGLINQEDFFNKQVASKDLSKYILLKNGEFAYNKSYSKDYPVGAIKRLDRYEEGVLSVLYICFALDSSKHYINTDYATYLFESSILHSGISVVAKEGARNHGLLNITADDFFSISVPLPTKEEQIEMARILQDVDKHISNINKQINNLTMLKKALAKKLFNEGIGHIELKDSQIGTIPLDWKVYNINEVAKRNTGHTPDKKNEDYWNGNIPWISLKDLKMLDKRIIDKTTDYVADKGIRNSSAVLLPQGTVVISRDATVGKIGIMGREMATSQHFVNYVSGEKLNNVYLYYWLLTNKHIFEQIAIGSTIKTIGMKFFESLMIPVPEIEEQKKIADILWSIDEEIVQYNAQYADYTKLKEGLMQQLLTGKIRVKIWNWIS